MGVYIRIGAAFRDDSDRVTRAHVVRLLVQNHNSARNNVISLGIWHNVGMMCQQKSQQITTLGDGRGERRAGMAYPPPYPLKSLGKCEAGVPYSFQPERNFSFLCHGLCRNLRTG